MSQNSIKPDTPIDLNHVRLSGLQGALTVVCWWARRNSRNPRVPFDAMGRASWSATFVEIEASLSHAVRSFDRGLPRDAYLERYRSLESALARLLTEYDAKSRSAQVAERALAYHAASMRLIRILSGEPRSPSELRSLSDLDE